MQIEAKMEYLQWERSALDGTESAIGAAELPAIRIPIRAS